MDGLRWTALFADLEGELEGLEAADFAAEVRERARYEFAQLPLVARLRGAEGRELMLGVRGVGTLRGRLQRVGPGWVLVGGRPGTEVLVPLAAVVHVTGLGTPTAPFRAEEPAGRLGLGHALRELARRRAPVHVALVDGSALHGTFERVGADFVELAEDEPKTVHSVPWTALAAVRAG